MLVAAPRGRPAPRHAYRLLASTATLLFGGSSCKLHVHATGFGVLTDHKSDVEAITSCAEHVGQDLRDMHPDEGWTLLSTMLVAV